MEYNGHGSRPIPGSATIHAIVTDPVNAKHTIFIRGEVMDSAEKALQALLKLTMAMLTESADGVFGCDDKKKGHSAANGDYYSLAWAMNS